MSFTIVNPRDELLSIKNIYLTEIKEDKLNLSNPIQKIPRTDLGEVLIDNLSKKEVPVIDVHDGIFQVSPQNVGGFTFQFSKTFTQENQLVELSFSPEIEDGENFLFLSKFYLIVESYESDAEDEIKLSEYLFDRVKIQK